MQMLEYADQRTVVNVIVLRRHGFAGLQLLQHVVHLRQGNAVLRLRPLAMRVDFIGCGGDQKTRVNSSVTGNGNGSKQRDLLYRTLPMNTPSEAAFAGIQISE